MFFFCAEEKCNCFISTLRLALSQPNSSEISEHSSRGYFFGTNFNAHFNMNMYVILSSTCFGPWHAHFQEEQLYKHSIWYPRSTRQLHTTPVESWFQKNILYYDARSEKHQKKEWYVYKVYLYVFVGFITVFKRFLYFPTNLDWFWDPPRLVFGG